MKAILEFDLPLEEADHRSALDGWRWEGAAEAYRHRLRDTLKHGELSGAERAVWEEAQRVFLEETEGLW